MSDLLTDYRSLYARPERDYWATRMANAEDLSAPIVPRRVTEHGRMMYADDLGLPLNQTPAYFWLGRDAEASDAGI